MINRLTNPEKLEAESCGTIKGKIYQAIVVVAAAAAAITTTTTTTITTNNNNNNNNNNNKDLNCYIRQTAVKQK